MWRWGIIPIRRRVSKEKIEVKHVKVEKHEDEEEDK